MPPMRAAAAPRPLGATLPGAARARGGRGQFDPYGRPRRAFRARHGRPAGAQSTHDPGNLQGYGRRLGRVDQMRAAAPRRRCGGPPHVYGRRLAGRASACGGQRGAARARFGGAHCTLSCPVPPGPLPAFRRAAALAGAPCGQHAGRRMPRSARARRGPPYGRGAAGAFHSPAPARRPAGGRLPQKGAGCAFLGALGALGKAVFKRHRPHFVL